MLLRADHLCSVTKPQSPSVLARFVYTIDIFLPISRICWIVIEIEVEIEMPILIFEPQKVNWIDDDFVDIVVLSDNVDRPI